MKSAYNSQIAFTHTLNTEKEGSENLHVGLKREKLIIPRPLIIRFTADPQKNPIINNHPLQGTKCHYESELLHGGEMEHNYYANKKYLANIHKYKLIPFWNVQNQKHRFYVTCFRSCLL